MDIYKKLKPQETEGRLLNVGRAATAVVVLLGVVWIPIMEKIGGGVMYQYLQSVQSYIAPPITAVFVLGILWKRVNSKAAIVTLFSGLLLAALRIGAELYYSEAINHFKATGEHLASGLAYHFAVINFANMAIFMCLFSALVCVGVSLMTQAPNYARIQGLSFGTLSAADRKETRESFSWVDVVLSVILVLVVLSVLTYFTG